MKNHWRHPWAARMSAMIFITGLAFFIFAQNDPVPIIHPPGDFVLVNGAKLWYEIEGKGEPLLLIPGGPGSSHTGSGFHPYFSTLSDSYRIIYFDAFGRGKSDRAASPREYTFERDVEDIEGIRQALHLGKINVFGFSYGGMVAQAYALKYPNSVKKLILAHTLFSAEMWQANNDNWNNEIRNQCPELWDKIQKLRALGFHSSAKAHQEIYGQAPAGLFFFYNASNADKLVSEYNWDVYYSMAGDDADFLIGGDLATLDFRTQLKNLKMPLLILASRFDRVAIPRFAIQFKQYAPQAEFVMFEKAGHFSFLEDPGSFFKVLRVFLSR